MTADRPANVLNRTEPVPVVSAADTVTLVDGSTFCLSERTGDIRPDTTHGFFLRDTRFVSTWRLRIDGQTPLPLTVLTPEAFAARFVLRHAPRSGVADSTVLVIRERLVADGLRETITIENVGREATAVTLMINADADFADLFAVKAGRSPAGTSTATVAGNELLLRDPSDSTRVLSITASSHPIVVPGSMSWRVVIPPRDSWRAEIVAQPTLTDERMQERFHGAERLEMSAPARKIQAWRSARTAVVSDDPLVTRILRRSDSDLGTLQVHDDPPLRRPYIAAGAPWFMTLFGRDSLITAWMALPLDVELALGTLERLAEVQGTNVDPITEEEPGRILHELRRGPASAEVLGGRHYYGTVDATPLFVALLAESRRWGADEQTVQQLMPAADAALSWINDFGDRDGDGFVEYERATDRGLANQGWKDSFDGINDASGRLAIPPVALCEVQGYVYAALLSGAELAEASGDSTRAKRLQSRAEDLRSKFAEAYWLPDKGWYAVALDGAKNPVDALTSNAAHCLWSGIALDEHAAALIERLASDDMNTGYGLRTLARSMGAYNPMSYHNGSVWPHDTAIAVAGLLRYRHLPGAVELAERLATGLLEAAAAFDGRLPELFCGFARSEFGAPIPYPTSCSPQAWASAAPLLLVRAFLGLEPHVPTRTLKFASRIPERWGTLALNDLRLGDVTVDISASGNQVSVRGLPASWHLIADEAPP
ncbi:MAG TPA: glycogen debranching N-terminal domain-containing protein [Jiangellaceae bacterium]|nr:glycogen debranching N-terminal domain-containing protein [Jiangellaceae bacterium]